MCYNVLQVNGGNSEGSQMTVPVKNKMWPSGLEEKEAGNFCCGWLFPCAQEEPRVQWPKHPGGNHRQRCVPHDREYLAGVTVTSHQSPSFTMMPSHIPGTVELVLFRVIFLFLTQECLEVQMSKFWGKTHKVIPNLSIATHSSSGGSPRIFLSLV